MNIFVTKIHWNDTTFLWKIWFKLKMVYNKSFVSVKLFFSSSFVRSYITPIFIHEVYHYYSNVI
jgi:hypothetical protein